MYALAVASLLIMAITAEMAASCFLFFIVCFLVHALVERSRGREVERSRGLCSVGTTEHHACGTQAFPYFSIPTLWYSGILLLTTESTEFTEVTTLVICVICVLSDNMTFDFGLRTSDFLTPVYSHASWGEGFRFWCLRFPEHPQGVYGFRKVLSQHPHSHVRQLRKDY